jgi:amidase/nitrilase
MSEAVPDGFSEDELGFNVAAGGSMLVNPAGIVKAGPLIGEEGLLTAEFRDDERRATKAYFDAMGHYTRWDAVNLSISDETLAPSQPQEASKHAVAGNGSLSAARAQAIADEYDVPVEAVEAVADELVG